MGGRVEGRHILFSGAVYLFCWFIYTPIAGRSLFFLLIARIFVMSPGQEMGSPMRQQGSKDKAGIFGRCMYTNDDMSLFAM